MIPNERRAKPRIDCAYPALVRGLNAHGKLFKAQGTLCNFSAVGIYLSLDRPIEVGSQVSISFRLSSQPAERAEVAIIAARGVVIRRDAQSKHEFGIGVKVNQYRFR